MLKRIILLFYLILLNLSVNAQGRGDYIWELGFSSSKSINPLPKSLSFDFSECPVIIDTTYRPLSFLNFNCSIANPNGELLLYSNGCEIRDGNHNLIPNSKHLSPGATDVEYCNLGYTVSDGGLFLPFNNNSLILLLHQRDTVESNPTKVYVNTLFYTTLELQNNTYQIINKSIPLINDTLSLGMLEAIKSQNWNEWWVLQGKKGSSKYYTIKFNSGRVDTTFVQDIGVPSLGKSDTGGQSAFSPNGKIFARFSLVDDLFLFDFNTASGYLSNFRKIHVADSGLLGGIAFSPDSRFLYVSSQFDLYQFDMSAQNIQDSKTHIDHFDGFFAPFPATFYHMQLAPDQKVYMIPPNGISYMHVINKPNNKGIECQFEQHGIRMPASNSVALPNFPVFGVFNENICDSITSVKNESLLMGESMFNIFPNPCQDVLYIDEVDKSIGGNQVILQVVSPEGIILKSTIIDDLNNYIYIDDLLPGFYYLNLSYSKYYYTYKFIKI